jgi:hypothetical protein
LSYTTKARIIGGGPLEFCGEPLPLACGYVLGSGTESNARRQRLSPRASMIEWIRNSYLLDIEDRATLDRQFGNIAGLVANIPLYRLDYPRRYDALADVRRIVLGAEPASEAA